MGTHLIRALKSPPGLLYLCVSTQQTVNRIKETKGGKTEEARSIQCRTCAKKTDQASTSGRLGMNRCVIARCPGPPGGQLAVAKA